MSLDFGLQRFDKRGRSSPKHARVLDDLLNAIREGLPANDDRYGVRRRGSKSLDLQLASGVGTVRPDHAAFNLNNLEDDDLKLVYAIARTGDMVVITEDGSVIVTDSKQREHVPQDLGSDNKGLPVARSWKELARLLRTKAGPALTYRDQVIASYEGTERADAGPPPTGGAGTTAVYVQPREGEKEMQQLRRLFKATDRFIAGRAGRRIEGTIGGLSWSLRVPTGELFIGCVVTGDVPDWMEFFRDYSRGEKRCFGTIEDRGTKFVVNDGRAFPMDECKLRRLTDAD